MEIQIMNRQEAIHYTYLPHKEKTIIISISEGNSNKPYFCTGRDIVDILYLFFDDIVKEDLLLDPMYKIMQPQHALAIKDFVDNHKNDIDKIIVHCYAGISRSSAVAVGICRYLGLDDIWIWKGNYSPNKWVLEIMNSTLELGFTEEDIKLREDIKKKSWEASEYKDEIESIFLSF